MGIKVFWFIAQMNNWQMVVDEQLKCLQESGLYDAADEIRVCVAGRKRLDLPDKCRVTKRSLIKQYEFPALEMVKTKTKPGDKVLYIHTKGVSKIGIHAEPACRWRQYMMWGCVERWREHIANLDDYDLSGVQLTRLNRRFASRCKCPVVYGGNFWWAKGEHIASLPTPAMECSRWEAEGWVLQGKPKTTEIHNLTGGKMITTKNTFYLPDFSRSWYDPEYKEKTPRMVAARHEIINELIGKFNYMRYLEIGVFNFDCYHRISCGVKACVDPNVKQATHTVTSDEFFKHNRKQWDIVFIDGLHTEEQAYQDVINALDCLREGGTIIMHDCNPETEWEQRDTTDYDGDGIWVGTVWKAFARLRMERPDLCMAVIDTDFGCGVIRRGKQECYETQAISFPYFVQNRKDLMNVIDPENFWTWLDTLK